MEFTLEELLAQEEQLQFKSFSHEAALKLGLTILGRAKNGEFGQVAVNVELNGTSLFLHLMEGTNQDNIAWIARKKRVVDRFHHSSLYMGMEWKSRGADFNELLDKSEYQALGGSFPLIIKGVGVVGSVTVSGLPDRLDHKLCVDGIRQYLEENEQ